MSSSRLPLFAVVAGGGTMGHLMPGIAVANELVERGIAKDRIHFVGSKRGVEAKVVPDAGYGLTLLPGRGIQRRFAFANFAAVAGILLGVLRAIILVRKLRPQVILSTGGYASVACVVAARIWRTPVVVAESNAIAGAANRFASRQAKVSAVAFDVAALPRQIVTGNPVRDEILQMANAPVDTRKSSSRSKLGLNESAPLVVAFGGSLGARRINHAVIGLAEKRPELNIYHVIGHRDWSMFADQIESLGSCNPNYRAVEYERNMQDVLSAADLVVCRSGATSVAEIAAIGVASILVPLPIATQDHQTANARSLVAVGAAVLVTDEELDEERLVECVDELAADAARLAKMATSARSLAFLDAASRVADLVEEHRRQ